MGRNYNSGNDEEAECSYRRTAATRPVLAGCGRTGFPGGPCGRTGQPGERGLDQCPSAPPADPRLDELRRADPNDTRIDVTSNSGELGREGDATLHGNVNIRMGQKLLKADEADIDANKRSINLRGDVEYLDPQLHVKGSGGSFEGQGVGQFEGAEFELLDRSVRGAAQDASLLENGTIDLKGVKYTACPPGNEDWGLAAGEISIDQKTQLGTGRDVRIDFMGVPILYTPWISFPVGDQRKSGLLFPTIGSSSKSGTLVAVPWYWNIAPNYDATFTARWFSTRGFRIDPEFRYLTERSRGVLEAEYLLHDDQTGESRSFVELRHVTRFDSGTRLVVDAANVSDTNYFEDFGSGFEGTSVTFLDRLAELRHDTDHWWLRARAQDYQVIDRELAAEDRPYSILPQFTALGRWSDLPGGLSARFLADATNFQRDLGPDGVRAEANPSVEWRVDGHGAFLAANAGYDYLQYALSNNDAGGPTRRAAVRRSRASTAASCSSARRDRRARRSRRSSRACSTSTCPTATRTTCRCSTPDSRTSTWCSCSAPTATSAATGSATPTRSASASRRACSTRTAAGSS